MTTFTGSVDNAVIRQGVPAVPTTAFRVSCPTCHHAADVPARAAGRTVKCPKCRESFTAAPAQVSSDDTCRTGNDSETFGVAASATPPNRRHSNGRTVVNNDGGRRRLILAAVAVAVVALAGGGWWYKVRSDRYEAMLADRTEYANERRHAIGMSELWDVWKEGNFMRDADDAMDAMKSHNQKADRLLGEYEQRYGAASPKLAGLNANRWSASELSNVKTKEAARRIGTAHKTAALVRISEDRKQNERLSASVEAAIFKDELRAAVKELRAAVDAINAEFAAIR